MDDEETERYVLRTDEETEAVRSLEMVAELLPRVEADRYLWKWVAIALQNAVQGYLVLALRGTSRARILKPSATKKYLAASRSGDHAGMSRVYPMDDFMGLYRKLQDEPTMGMYRSSRCFTPTGTVTTSMERLVAMRNTFVHFIPMMLLEDVVDLPRVVVDAAEVIAFVMFESGNAFATSVDELHERTRHLLVQVRRDARHLGAVYPTLEE